MFTFLTLHFLLLFFLHGFRGGFRGGDLGFGFGVLLLHLLGWYLGKL